MPYCPHCGNAVDTLPGVSAEADREPVEVTLARIEADKAVTIAKLENRARREELETAETIAETEAGADVAAAVAQAEVIAAAAEPEPEPDPLVIDAPTVDVGDDDQDDDALPEREEGTEPPEPRRKARGIGMW